MVRIVANLVAVRDHVTPLAHLPVSNLDTSVSLGYKQRRHHLVVKTTATTFK